MVLGPLFMSRVFEKECPADPGSSPGEGDNKYTATTVVYYCPS